MDTWMEEMAFLAKMTRRGEMIMTTSSRRTPQI
jgi:hypothetical protein